jgi:hypothetical protein
MIIENFNIAFPSGNQNPSHNVKAYAVVALMVLAAFSFGCSEPGLRTCCAVASAA